MTYIYLGIQKSALNKAFIETMIVKQIFPSDALTESDVSFYQDGTSLQEWLNTPTNKVDYMVYDADTLNLLDKNEETSANYWKIIWKFPEPVSAKTLKMNMNGRWDGKFYATNDTTACFNAWDSWTFSEELGEVLLEDSSRNEWGDMPLNPSKKYQYFFLSSPFNGSPNYFKEVELELGENDKPSDELLKVFPSEPITADSENYFYRNEDNGKQNFLAYEGDVAYLGSYEDSYKVLDKDDTVSIANTNMWIKFKEPIVIKTFSAKIGNIDWRVYATNDESVFASAVNTNNSSMSSFTTLIENGEECGEEMTDFTVNSEGVAYRYYVFAARKTSANVYEIAFKTE